MLDIEILHRNSFGCLNLLLCSRNLVGLDEGIS
jgi:hypothetical protein